MVYYPQFNWSTLAQNKGVTWMKKWTVLFFEFRWCWQSSAESLSDKLTHSSCMYLRNKWITPNQYTKLLVNYECDFTALIVHGFKFCGFEFLWFSFQTDFFNNPQRRIFPQSNSLRVTPLHWKTFMQHVQI